MSTLYTEAVNTSPRPARIGFLLSQLGTHASDEFAARVRELGLTPSEAGVIRIIGRRPRISQRELADLLGAVQSRVVALVDRLEAAGLATRARSATDRRVQELALTDAGRDTLRALRSIAEAGEEELTAGLSANQRDDLYQLLDTLSTLRGLHADVHVGYREREGESAREL
jgi:DNA-binding MarR family transcriptional regulator